MAQYIILYAYIAVGEKDYSPYLLARNAFNFPNMLSTHIQHSLSHTDTHISRRHKDGNISRTECYLWQKYKFIFGIRAHFYILLSFGFNPGSTSVRYTLKWCYIWGREAESNEIYVWRDVISHVFPVARADWNDFFNPRNNNIKSINMQSVCLMHFAGIVHHENTF